MDTATPEVGPEEPLLIHSMKRRRWVVFVLAGAVFGLAAFLPWHSDERVRRAAGIVLATLILWISEVAPLGVTALAIPVAATLAGVMGWSEAVVAWGDPVIFLFLGAFLLARALEKHGVLEAWALGAWSQRITRGSNAGLILAILLVSGLISTMQNNTAVTAMLVPVVLRLGRTSRMSAIALLALSYGATFGGMAAPVGTAPNFKCAPAL